MARYTHPVDFEGTFWTVLDGDYYVSTLGSDVIGDGSPQNPFLTINKAFEFAIDGEKVIIGPDEYVEQETEVVSPGSFGAEPPCRVATTADISLSIGGVITIDGVIAQPGDRVLVWNQVSPVENGIYIIQSGPWQRADNFDSNDNIIRGKLIPVLEGSTYASTIFQNISASDIILGTTPINFSQVNGSSGGGTGNPGDIDAAINALKDGVPSSADTLNKLYGLILGLGNLSSTDIDTLSELNTILVDSNLISEIEFDSRTGFLDNLSTTDKSNLVAAINELKTAVDAGGGGGGGPTSLTNGSGTTANGTSVDLGGNLSANTLIDIGTRIFEILGTAAGITQRFRINQNAAVLSALNIDGQGASISTSEGRTVLQVTVSDEESASIVIDDSNKMVVRDDIFNEGLSYQGDYSSNYTNRSLVDKGYVDAAVAGAGGGGGALTNGSGTTANGSGIDLGGPLSSNAEINASGQSFKVINNDIPAGRLANLHVDDASIIISTTANDFTSSLHIGTGFASLSFDNEMAASSAIDLGSSGMVITDNVNSQGLLYQDDYSSGFSARSLVDKGYVDAAVAASGGGGGTTVPMPIFQVGKSTQQQFEAPTNIANWEAEEIFNDPSSAYSWNNTVGELSIQQDGVYEIMFETSCIVSFGSSRSTAKTGISVDGAIVDDSERLAYLRIKDHGASTSASHIVSRAGSNVIIKAIAERIVGTSTCVVDRAKLIVKRIG